MTKHAGGDYQSALDNSLHSQIGPYDEMEHQDPQASANNKLSPNIFSNHNKKEEQKHDQYYKPTKISERGHTSRTYSEIGASKHHSIKGISSEYSRRFETMNGMARRKASLTSDDKNNDMLRPRNRSGWDRFSDTNMRKPSKMDIYRSIDFESENQKYQENGFSRNRNMVMIQLTQWREYSRKLRRWIRFAYRQSRVTFCYPPLPPRHLIIGIPSILLYFIDATFSYIMSIFSCRRSKRTSRCLNLFCYAFTLAAIIASVVVIIVVNSFFSDATKICRPPNKLNSFSNISPSVEGQPRPRPLIEYYVHGRGNGHYSRSIAIIRKLNAAGIDVRMFIGRASMWKEIQSKGSYKKEMPKNTSVSVLSKYANEARRVAKLILFSEETGSLLHDLTRENTKPTEELNQLQDLFDELPWENEYALHYNFASQAELPYLNQKDHQSNDETAGTTTAISVASLIPKLTFLSTISHAVERISGDCDVSHQTSRYPDLVLSDGDMPGMLRARIGNIPSVSISHGTTFAVAKTGWKGNDRHWKRAWFYQIVLNMSTGFFSDWFIGTNFIPLDVKNDYAVIAKPPFRREVLDVAKIRSLRKNRNIEGNEISEGELGATKRNKLVLCYFRDKNGIQVVDVLLELGFDVVVFNPAGEEQVKETGKQWKMPSRKREGVEITWSNSDPNNHHFDILDYSLNSYSDTTASDAHDEKEDSQSNTHDSHRNLHELSSLEIDNHLSHTVDRNTLLQMFSSTSNEPRVIKVYDKNLFVAFMGIVDGIVGSGGSQLISESIYGQIPMLALHRNGDTEQMLNIEMLRRKRDEDIEILMTKQDHLKNELQHSADGNNHLADVLKLPKADLPPEVYGTSIETFLSNFSKGHSAPEVTKEQTYHNIRKSKKEYKKILRGESVLARKELQGFIDAVRNSVISESYYNDIFHFLNSPDDQSTAKRIKEPNRENDSPFPNKWLDGMPDAAEVIIEIVHELA